MVTKKDEDLELKAKSVSWTEKETRRHQHPKPSISTSDDDDDDETVFGPDDDDDEDSEDVQEELPKIQDQRRVSRVRLNMKDVQTEASTHGMMISSRPLAEETVAPC